MSLTLFILLFALLGVGIPVAFAIGLSSFLVVMISENVPFILMITKIFGGVDSFVLLAIPFFVATGEIMNKAGLTAGIVQFSNTVVGHLRGGLAHVNILCSMVFAGVSGSCIADSSAIGSVLIPSMTKDGYDKDFAIAVTATSSTIGPIIPPSIMMVLYASIANVSIGRMFLGGIIPGTLIGLSLMLAAYLVCIKRGYTQKAKRATFKELAEGFRVAIPALVAPIIIIGGIVSGIFTATEAGVIAVVYSLVAGFFILKTLKLMDLKDIFVDSAVTTTIVMLIIAMASIFAQMLARDLFHIKMYSMLTTISDSQHVLILIIMLFLLVLGCIVDGAAIIIIFGAIFAKIGAQLGFDPIHFGVVVVMTTLIGAVTPPVGTLLFVCCSIAKTNLLDGCKCLAPFLAALVVVCFLAAYIPQLVTYVPNLFMP